MYHLFATQHSPRHLTSFPTYTLDLTAYQFSSVLLRSSSGTQYLYSSWLWFFFKYTLTVLHLPDHTYLISIFFRVTVEHLSCPTMMQGRGDGQAQTAQRTAHGVHQLDMQCSPFSDGAFCQRVLEKRTLACPAPEASSHADLFRSTCDDFAWRKASTAIGRARSSFRGEE